MKGTTAVRRIPALLFAILLAGLAAYAPAYAEKPEEPFLPLDFAITEMCVCDSGLEEPGYRIDDEESVAVLFGKAAPEHVRKYHAFGESGNSTFTSRSLDAIVIRQGGITAHESELLNAAAPGPDAEKRLAAIGRELEREMRADYAPVKHLELVSVNTDSVRFNNDGPRAVRLTSVIKDARTGKEWRHERYHFLAPGWTFEMYVASVGAEPDRYYPSSVVFITE